MTAKLEKSISLALPTVPSFIRSEDEKVTFGIHELDDDTLRAIGEAWTAKLIENAKRKRGGDK